MPYVSPLNHQTPIVDDEGRPTPAFIQWSQTQLAQNKIIPDLSTAAKLSAYLDKISSTANDILVRGTAVWGASSPPADSTKFLNGANPIAWAAVKDTDLALADETTQNATSARHGFLKKLNNDITMFMRGDGVWAVPPSASGGVAEWDKPWGMGPTGATWGSANYFSGRIFTAPENITVGSVKIRCGTATASAVVSSGIYTVDGSGNPVTLLNTTPVAVTGTVWGVNKFSLGSYVTLTKDATYWFGIQTTVAAIGANVLPYNVSRAYFATSGSYPPSTAPAVTWRNNNWPSFWLAAEL